MKWFELRVVLVSSLAWCGDGRADGSCDRPAQSLLSRTLHFRLVTGRLSCDPASRSLSILGHRAIDLLQRECGKYVRFGVSVPTIAHAEAPQPLRSRRPFHKQVRMLRIDLHGKLQHVKGPNRSRRASVLNRQFPLDLTTNVA